MAGADRMTIEEVVRDVLVREHGDVLQAALEAVCVQLMEGEVSAQIGAELGEHVASNRALSPVGASTWERPRVMCPRPVTCRRRRIGPRGGVPTSARYRLRSNR
jgi:hypothetical protein